MLLQSNNGLHTMLFRGKHIISAASFVSVTDSCMPAAHGTGPERRISTSCALMGCPARVRQ